MSPKSGNTTYLLGDIKWRHELYLRIGHEYLLTLEVSADNAPAEVRTYELRIDSPRVTGGSDVLGDKVHFKQATSQPVP